MLAIYSNTGEWGGVDILIGRFASHLVSRGIDYYIIEPESGRIRNEFPNAKFVDFDKVQLIANRVTHVFVPSVSKLRDPLFPWEKLGHAKIMTWVVHPNDIFRSFFPYSTSSMNIVGYRVVKPLRYLLRSHCRLFDATFSRLVRERSLIVMDGATLRSLKYFVPTLDEQPDMVPIPAPLSDEVSVRHKDSKILSIGYLGRMDVMKWSAIQPFVRDTLAPLTKRRQIALHIVSEGIYLSRLEKLCSNTGIEFHGYGYLPNLEARKVIFTQTNLAIAMGTSALDIAGSGHPCLILDPSLGKFASRQMNFRFVDEIEDYTLGEFRDFPGYVPGLERFENLIDESQLGLAGLKGREYVSRSHDPEICFDRLAARIQGSSLLVGELGKDIRALLFSFDKVKANPVAYLNSGSFRRMS